MEANLGFLYLTDFWSEHVAEILAFFTVQTGVRHWVGTVGMSICSLGKEYYDQPAMVVMIGKLDDDAFQVFSGINTLETLVTRDIKCPKSPAHFAVIHGDPHNFEMVDLVKELAQKVESGFVVGGLPYSRKENLQIADGVVRGGISGVLFSPKVAVSTRLTQGCTPLGPVHVVTESYRRSIIMSLDGKPALDVFKQDIGEILARDMDRAAGYIFVGLPTKGDDTGDYVVRNVAGIDPDHKLVALGLPAGEQLETGMLALFCRRDTDMARQDMARMLVRIKTDLKGPPKGGVYYSCMGRGVNLFGKNSEELLMIQQHLGDFPLAGCFCNGEISHDRLYSYTGVLTLFI